MDQTGFPSLIPPDGSTAIIPGLSPAAPLGQDLGVGLPHVPAGDQSMTTLTQATAYARGNPHANSFTSIMEGLKEVCSMMTTGFQRVCLDIEAIVQRTLEEATQLNRDFTVAAAKDLDLWAVALRPVLTIWGCQMLTWKQGRGTLGKLGEKSATRSYPFRTRWSRVSQLRGNQ